MEENYKFTISGSYSEEKNYTFRFNSLNRICIYITSAHNLCLLIHFIRDLKCKSFYDLTLFVYWRGLLTGDVQCLFS